MTTYTIRQTLLLIVAALIIPACLIAVGFSVKAYYDGRHSITSATLQTSRAMTLVVESELRTLQGVAQTLTHSRFLQTGNWPAFHQQARDVLRNTSGFTFVLTDSSGQQLINTLKPFGSALPHHGNEPLLSRVFATGKPAISDLFLGGVTKKPVLSVSVPVFKDGKVFYALDIGIWPQEFSKILVAQNIPQDWVVSIFDSTGTIVARNKAAEQFVGKKGSPELLREMAIQPEGILESTTLEGIPVFSMYSRSAATGWSVAIGVPKASVSAGLWHSLWLTTGGVIILLLTGLWIAKFAGARMTNAIRALGPQAVLLGRGEILSMPPLALEEAAALGAELTKASDVLQRTQQALHTTNEDLQRLLKERTSERDLLEQRVSDRTQELRDTLDFNEAILLHSPLPMGVYAANGQCVLVNDAYTEFIGATREALLAQNYHNIVAWQESGLLDDCRTAVAQEISQQREVHVVSSFGKEIWFACKIVPMHLSGEKHLLIQFFDLTERKRAEEQLRIVATAFESQEAMMITDAKTVILRVNRAFSECTGYSSAEVVGRTPSVFRSNHHDARFYATMWECIERDGAWHGEIWDQRKNGELFPNWLTITAVKNDDGVVTNYVGTQTDITTRKRAEEEIRLLAFFDTLTNLPNRRLLMDRLRQALASSARSRRLGALMLIDLDNFKTLNDTLGHDQGDALLQQVAQRLPACVRNSDTVARLGGDEFVVILEELSDNSEQAAIQTQTVGAKILDVLNQPYLLGGHECRSTPSIGITLFSNEQSNIEELLKRADLAMYQAKATGRNALRFFEPHMQTAVTAHAEMEAELRFALQRQEFILHYQPQVDCHGRVTGAEALVRWNHPMRGIVLPGEFISRTEDTGLIVSLGNWVLETACTQLAAWASQSDVAELTMAVNVSGRQIHRPDFVEQVLDVLERTCADPYRLQLELTESLLLDDMDDTIGKMRTLQEHGVSFALDDFGTGYSSLAYLKRLPLGQLKIDRSFVRDVLTDTNDAAIIRTILALGQTLGLAVIAEGVETEEQRIFLAENGCNAYQGFLFSHPVPMEEFEQLLAQVKR